MLSDTAWCCHSYTYSGRIQQSDSGKKMMGSFRGGNRSDDVRTTLRPYMGILEFKIFCTMSKVQNRHTGVICVSDKFKKKYDTVIL